MYLVRKRGFLDVQPTLCTEHLIWGELSGRFGREIYLTRDIHQRILKVNRPKL